MNYLYTVDPDAEEPIMLINKHIGFDKEDGIGIMGDQFQTELLSLDAAGKKTVHVWINSVGGSVMDGYSICSAIMNSKCRVNTHCKGVAASIAGVIFETGRVRVMSDYGLVMIHNPYGGDDDTGLMAIRNSLIDIICKRSGLSLTEVSQLMNATSWLDSSDCLDKGLCDVIEMSDELNIRKVRQAKEINDKWQIANTILNKVITPKTEKNMKNVCNKLGLVQDASEDSILAAIDLLEVKNKKMSDEMEDKFKKCKEELDAKNKEYETMKSEYETMKKAKSEADEMDAENKSEEMVNKAITEGRILKEAKDTWKASAKKDIEGTKNMIESLPINKKGPSIAVVAKDKAETPNGVIVAGSAMAAIRAKLGI